MYTIDDDDEIIYLILTHMYRLFSSFQLLPLEKGGSANHLPPSSPSSPLLSLLLFATAINLVSALPAACHHKPAHSVNLRHTHRNIFGASLVPQWFSGMDADGWTRTGGGTVNIYIHCPCLALSQKKIRHTAASILSMSVLVKEKLYAAESKPGNIAALTL